MYSNELYLAVLPVIHLSSGATEQMLTLFPDRNFATEFSAQEVDQYISFFQTRADSYLVGGHVKSYHCQKEPAGGGRFVVLVKQNVD